VRYTKDGQPTRPQAQMNGTQKTDLRADNAYRPRSSSKIIRVVHSNDLQLNSTVHERPTTATLVMTVRLPILLATNTLQTKHLSPLQLRAMCVNTSLATRTLVDAICYSREPLKSFSSLSSPPLEITTYLWYN